MTERKRVQERLCTTLLLFFRNLGWPLPMDNDIPIAIGYLTKEPVDGLQLSE
jgi:hypothetical protein